MDKNRLCPEYWESRLFQSHSHNEGVNSLLKIQDRNNPDSLTSVADGIVSGLFKKANLEELNTILSALNNDGDKKGVTELLKEEILKRPR